MTRDQPRGLPAGRRIVERASGTGPSAGKCPADRRIEAFLSDHFATSACPGRSACPASSSSCRGTGSPARCRSRRGRTATATRSCGRTACERRAAQPAQRPAHDRAGRSTSRKAGCRSPATRRRCPGGLRGAVPAGGQPAGRHAVVPFTADRPEPLRTFVSLLLRPVVRPGVPGVCAEKPMEVRFFAPGGWSATWTSSSRSSATPAIPACRRTTPGWTWSTGPGHTGLRDPGAAPDSV